MRILYLTQWFEPEPNIVKGLRFVHALEAAGHEVTVVTGFPNYPTGRLYPGYRLRPMQRETLGGVRVVRLAHFLSHDASSLRRSVNFLSFFAAALSYLLLRRERFALVYVYHPPITVGLAAALAGCVRRLPFVLDVQDLWPETVAASGMRGARTLAGLLGAACRFVYRRATRIITQSEGMRHALIERGVPAAKVVSIRNWADLDDASSPEATPAPQPSNHRLTLVYGGNLGRAQGLETAVDAAALVQQRRRDVEIVLYGDGVEAVALKAKAARGGLGMLRFEPRIPKADIVSVFRRADGLLMHLRDEPLFGITIPSKTQFYLAMGRPIIAGIAGEAAELLRESGAALVAPPGDAEALAQAIEVFADLPPETRAAMGEHGRRFYGERFAFEKGIARTLELLEGIHLDQAGSDRASKP